MGFVVSFAPFCTVRCEEHGSGRPVTAFELAPTAECRRRLADHEMVFRPRRSGFELFYKTNPANAQPLLGAIAGPTRFSFALQLREPDFFERYHPDLTAETGPNLYLDNLAPPGGTIEAGGTLSAAASVEVADAARIGARVYVEQVDRSAPAPTSLAVKNRFDGTAITTVAVPTEGSRVAVAIDLTARPEHVFELAEEPGGSPSKTIYTDDDLAGAGAAGVVDIHWDQPQTAVPASGLAFTIPFRKR